MEKIVIRQCFKLADRMSHLAEIVRNASRPHHLNFAKRRYLRHLAELNHIRDRWADTFKATRRYRSTARPYPLEQINKFALKARYRRD